MAPRTFRATKSFNHLNLFIMIYYLRKILKKSAKFSSLKNEIEATMTIKEMDRPNKKRVQPTTQYDGEICDGHIIKMGKLMLWLGQIYDDRQTALFL